MELGGGAVLRGSLELSPQNREARLGSGGSDCLFRKTCELDILILFGFAAF